MSYQICYKHNRVTAWGCPECRREAVRDDMEKITKETLEKIRAAFRATDAKESQ